MPVQTIVTIPLRQEADGGAKSATWAFAPLGDFQPPDSVPTDRLPGWPEAARAFDAALAASPATDSCHVCLGLFGRAERLVRLWMPPGAQVLEAPSALSLLEGTAVPWPELQEPDGAPLVIPALERCFLRHHRGLGLLRKLVESRWSARRRLVIGCDVWAWKYLRQAVQIDALCLHPLTAAPLAAYPGDEKLAPPLPSEASAARLRTCVLHALLIHYGLTAEVLALLLPFHTTETLRALTDLREEQLVFEMDRLWRVVPEKQRDIRRQLAEARFWVGDI